jgi:hypothetical protein
MGVGMVDGILRQVGTQLLQEEGEEEHHILVVRVQVEPAGHRVPQEVLGMPSLHQLVEGVAAAARAAQVLRRPQRRGAVAVSVLRGIMEAFFNWQVAEGEESNTQRTHLAGLLHLAAGLRMLTLLPTREARTQAAVVVVVAIMVRIRPT